MSSLQDTIAAIATPLGEGGVGVIRVSGQNAIALAQTFFQANHPLDLARASANSCYVGAIVGEKRLDHVVLTLFRAPRSYTGEDVVEISAHGSPLILQEILALCLARGARLAGPGEFTQRAFLNGKLDLTQAEAVADLIRAKTEKTKMAALSQLEGRLAERVRALRDTLLPLLAHIEVGLDHADEDHDFLQRDILIDRCQHVQNQIDAILASERVGKILRQGLHVALVGRPNVGKSSLLNAFLGEDRAIVTPIPGTTRDTLEEQTRWEGLPVVLTDTAGLRQVTQDPVESLGMERSKKALKHADLVLALFDGAQPWSREDEDIVHQAAQRPHLWVVTKSDLPRRFDSRELDNRNGSTPALFVSSKTGEGLGSLINTIKRFAWGEQATAAEADWLLNARHTEALRQAKDAVARASAGAVQRHDEECVALELRTALSALGEIIGETTTDDLLDRIFSTFCIGK